MSQETKQSSIEEIIEDFESRYSYLYQGSVYENGGSDFSPVHESVKHWLRTTLHTEEVERRVKIDENTSDGYHTFKELYEFRKLYNALLFNQWSMLGIYDVHKSKKHHDGEECFGGGWFIVVAQLPSGQISNHYELKDWHLFDCEERERGAEWDGHTPQDVLTRMASLTPPEATKTDKQTGV